VDGGPVYLPVIRYVRSPASFLVLSTLRPIFLETVPEMNPRTLWFLCRCRHKAHSLRGFLSTAAKKHGVKIESNKSESGGRLYRAAK